MISRVSKTSKSYVIGNVTERSTIKEIKNINIYDGYYTACGLIEFKPRKQENKLGLIKMWFVLLEVGNRLIK